MRGAPPVVYPVGRCVVQGFLLLTLGGLGLVVLLGWIWSAAAPLVGEMAWMGSSLWAAWSLWACWRWQHTTVGQLQWDALASALDESRSAGTWRWLTGHASGGLAVKDIECVIDAQHWMLLHLKLLSAPGEWVWVSREHAPERWMDLKRALLASARRAGF